MASHSKSRFQDSCARVEMIVAVFTLFSASSNAAPSLYQTVPSGGVAVCPNSAVEFTCVGETELQFRDVDATQGIAYDTVISVVNQTSTTGVFRTVLTDINGSTLTSTATIDSVSLSDDGRNISCRDDTGQSNEQIASVQVEGPPLAPANLTFNKLSTTDTESSVNLTWFLDNQCVVVYHVEVTNTNTSNITNMNTTSQYIVLTLKTGVVYSFRVRGADSAGRGEWSGPFMFTPTPIPSSALSTKTPMSSTVVFPDLQSGAIAGIVIGILFAAGVLLVGSSIIIVILYVMSKRSKTRKCLTEMPPNQSAATANYKNKEDKVYIEENISGRNNKQKSDTYAEFELSGGSSDGATGSHGKGRGTVMQDDTRVNYGKIDHDRMNAANKSHPPAKPPTRKREGST